MVNFYFPCMEFIAIVAGFILFVFLLIQIGKSIIDRKYRMLFQGALLLWQLGAVIKILHWPGANVILIFAPILAFTFKFLSFGKQPPTLFDVTTLVWLALTSITFITRSLHIGDMSELIFASVAVLDGILFVVLVAWVIYRNVKKNNA